MRTTLRARLRELHDDEQGVSLIELVVAMGLMVVFMAIFTGAMVMVSRTTAKVDAVATTQLQANNAFIRLNKSVSYANAISTPVYSSSAGMWHVEWDSTATARTATAVSNTETCTQLAIDNTRQQLKFRTWTVDPTSASGYSALSSWTPIADKVTNGTSTSTPFTIPAQTAAASVGLQQLSINVVTATTSTPATSTSSSYTFTALNSSGASGSATPVCQQVAIGVTS